MARLGELDLRIDVDCGQCRDAQISTVLELIALPESLRIFVRIF